MCSLPQYSIVSSVEFLLVHCFPDTSFNSFGWALILFHFFFHGSIKIWWWYRNFFLEGWPAHSLIRWLHRHTHTRMFIWYYLWLLDFEVHVMINWEINNNFSKKKKNQSSPFKWMDNGIFGFSENSGVRLFDFWFLCHACTYCLLYLYVIAHYPLWERIVSHEILFNKTIETMTTFSIKTNVMKEEEKRFLVKNDTKPYKYKADFQPNNQMTTIA